MFIRRLIGLLLTIAAAWLWLTNGVNFAMGTKVDIIQMVAAVVLAILALVLVLYRKHPKKVEKVEPEPKPDWRDHFDKTYQDHVKDYIDKGRFP